MITFIWNADNLDRRASDGLVTTVHWRCTAQDSDYTASVYGTVGLEGDEPAIPYDSLTKDTVMAWVFDKLDKADIETQLADQIDAQKNPVQKSGVPW
jgi:hypothetical protein